MQTLSAALAMLRKDLRLMSKDPGALAILFLMPLVFILVMSFAMAKVFDPKAGAIKVAVAIEDDGKIGPELARLLHDSAGFEVVTASGEQRLDRAAAERLVASRSLPVAVIVPAGLSDAVAALMRSGDSHSREVLIIADPTLSPEVLGSVRGAVKGLAQQAAFRALGGASLDPMFQRLGSLGISVPEDTKADLERQTERRLSGGLGDLVEVREAIPAGSRMERRPNSVEQFVPGYALFGLFFIAIQIANNILEEKRLGTFRRLQVAPVPKWALLGGKLLAFMTVNMVQIAVLFAIGVWVLPRLGAPGMSFGPHPGGLVLVSLVASLTATSLGLFLAAVASTPARVSGLGLMIVITSAVLGGVMVPRFVMPEFMQHLGWLAPHTWGLMAFQDVLVRGAGLRAILPETAALLAFGVAFFGLAAWRFRWD